MKNLSILLLLFAAVIIVGCNKCSKSKAILLVENPQLINEEVKKVVANQISIDTSQTLVVASDSLYATKFILKFYHQRNFNPAWTKKGILTKQGDSLFFILKNADEYGLISTDYHFSKIDSLLKTAKDSITKKVDVVKIFEAELLLTDAFFTFAVHVSKGRLNVNSLTRQWKGDTSGINLVSILNSALKKNNIHVAIDSLEPKNEQYQKLKQALKNFKIEFKNSDWDSLSIAEPGSISFNERLKKRLIASHDYVEELNTSDTIKLLKSIKNFQCKHHLTEDGKIGKLTLKALQYTKQDYIHQIEMNMERWRIYNAPSEKRFAWVNIPKYEMHVMEADSLVMKSRVIVGQPTKPTPILKSTITNFLIYPYWNVPFSIATKEILPVIKRDASYLSKHNFEVLDRYNRIVDTAINWKKYNTNYFPWRLRQRMGADNSLGVLKFNFNNKYGVYLHDTNNRRLFEKEMRAISHGCIRLEKFRDFAEFLIRDDSLTYPVDSFRSDLLKEKQKYIYIRHPIPIYINYFTTEVDEYGEVYFFMDVYGCDEKMLKALYGN